MSWPVQDSLMIEPTESEGLDEINRFCDALISIKQEISDIIDNKISAKNSPLKNAPHSTQDISKENWPFAYSTNQAFFPSGNKTSKFWPAVSRVDNAFGDRHLICTCQSFDYIEREPKEVTT